MKKYLIAGLLVWIPLVITGWVLKLLIDTMDQTLRLLPERMQTDALFGFHVPGMGVILTVTIVLVTGVIAANFFGKKMLDWWHVVLQRIPIVSSVYGGVKQISDTLFSPEGKAFRKAVLVRYPQRDTWTVALLTGEPEYEVAEHLGHTNYSVFVPTTPNITAGFFLIVPKTDVIPLKMTVDQALKYIISMGVAEPPRLIVPSHTNGAEMKKSGTDPNP
ncbi:MAG: DUF502 domain-containing protein [Pseudomonadota bacterium]